MKFISAAIVLLASATIVTSLPVYPTTETTTDHPYVTPFDDDHPTETSVYDDHSYETPVYDDRPHESPDTSDEHTYEPDHEPSPTAYYSSETPPPTPTPTPLYTDDYCQGFSIKSPSGYGITWEHGSSQEVVFDFGSSKIIKVNYVDLMKDGSDEVVDKWATGPWYPENPTTGWHEIHADRHPSGDYQFLAHAQTEDDKYCDYRSVMFKVVTSGNDSYYEEDEHEKDYDDKYETDDTNYKDEDDDNYETEDTNYKDDDDDNYETEDTNYKDEDDDNYETEDTNYKDEDDDNYETEDTNYKDEDDDNYETTDSHDNGDGHNNEDDEHHDDDNNY